MSRLVVYLRPQGPGDPFQDIWDLLDHQIPQADRQTYIRILLELGYTEADLELQLWMQYNPTTPAPNFRTGSTKDRRRIVIQIDPTSIARRNILTTYRDLPREGHQSFLLTCLLKGWEQDMAQASPLAKMLTQS